jgi:hypothetical protein
MNVFLGILSVFVIVYSIFGIIAKIREIKNRPVEKFPGGHSRGLRGLWLGERLLEIIALMEHTEGAFPPKGTEEEGGKISH